MPRSISEFQSKPDSIQNRESLTRRQDRISDGALKRLYVNHDRFSHRFLRLKNPAARRVECFSMFGAVMNRSQRIVAVLYCLLVVYCCVWVPWHLVQGSDRLRMAGYGWIWSGPPSTEISPMLTTPDLSIIGLRLLAATALSTAAFLLAGKWRGPATLR